MESSKEININLKDDDLIRLNKIPYKVRLGEKEKIGGEEYGNYEIKLIPLPVGYEEITMVYGRSIKPK